MSYEQKYKNALEKLQEALTPTKDGCKISGLTRGCIENIFPELQESKDEKMKKAIMHILYENYTDAAVIEGVEIAEIVTWLEEQSKKKSADEVLKIRQELYQSGYNDGYKHGQEDTTISLEKESIEVDERMRKGIIRNLQFLMDKSEGFVKEDLQERIAWLEKQRENKTDFSNIHIWKDIVDMVLTENDGIGQYLDDPDTERIAKKLQERYGNIEKQGEQKQTWEPDAAQLIVIKDLIEDKSTSKVNKVILRGMLDEFKQFTNNCKRETDNYETEDSSQT